MKPPATNFEPPFDVTRASHIILNVPDLEACRTFYEEVIGLIVSDADADTAYLRGVEEVAHHSLVLKRTTGAATCDAIGFRVRTEDDLDRAKAYLTSRGYRAEWVERPFENRTLRVVDAIGMPVELVARMETRPRQHMNIERHKGAGALRFDHFQCLAHDVTEAGRFYTDLGFRVSDYFTDDNYGGHIFGLFLFRKNNPHDLVFLTRGGPRMHHFAYIVPESHTLFRACDIAGNIGYGDTIEHGLGRHGQGHQLFVYFRDPAGHRVEILPPPIQLIDLEDEPVEWEQKQRFTWGRPPPRSWLMEGSVFADTPLTEPSVQQPLITLEDFLARQEG